MSTIDAAKRTGNGTINTASENTLTLETDTPTRNVIVSTKLIFWMVVFFQASHLLCCIALSQSASRHSFPIRFGSVSVSKTLLKGSSFVSKRLADIESDSVLSAKTFRKAFGYSDHRCRRVLRIWGSTLPRPVNWMTPYHTLTHVSVPSATVLVYILQRLSVFGSVCTHPRLVFLYCHPCRSTW